MKYGVAIFFFKFGPQAKKSGHPCSRSSHVKVVNKTLVKSTPGVNFINDLRSAFEPRRSQKRKKDCLFWDFGIYGIKAACTLMKFTPDLRRG